MSLGWTKTQRHRKLKRKKSGAKDKRKRDSKGTTALIPLEGPLPAIRYGVEVKPESIEIRIKA